VTTGEAKRVKKADSPSDLTEISKRLEEQEAVSRKILATLDKFDQRFNEVGKIPIAQKPEDRVAAFKAATKIGETVGTQRNVDLRNPNASDSGFQPDDIIQIAPDSPKYAAYQLDADGFPVQAIYEYQCQACARIDPYVRGGTKKMCPDCKGTMFKTATGTYQSGTPAYGVVMNYLYTNKRKKRKYKVYFEKFSEGKRTEGLTEDEMVLCRR